MIDTQVVLKSVICSAYTNKSLDTYKLAEISLTILVENRDCRTLLNSLFCLPSVLRFQDRVELAKLISELFKVNNPSFGGISIDQIKPGLIVLLSFYSGIPEVVVVDFLNRLRKADPNTSGESGALGSLFQCQREMVEAIEKYWGRRSP